MAAYLDDKRKDQYNKEKAKRIDKQIEKDKKYLPKN